MMLPMLMAAVNLLINGPVAVIVGSTTGRMMMPFIRGRIIYRPNAAKFRRALSVPSWP